jgi:arylsulfatase A-like enzyme
VLPVLLALAAVAGCGRLESDQPPNVIVVVVDALRADHLSHYGYGRDTAHGLDAFAAHATRFTDCQAPTSWTNPAVASLFTGLHTARHRANAFGAVLPAELRTLAEMLRAGGWRTAAVSFNPGIRTELGFDQGFDEFDQFLGKSTAYPDISEMVTRVEGWLDRRPQGPFLLYLHPMNVHGPYRVPEEYQEVLLGRAPSPEFRYYADYMRAILRRGELEVRKQVPASYLQSLVDKYDTAIRHTSDQLARLFELLEDRDLYDHSLIVVTADHGEELFDHGGFSHGYTLHHEVLHVPLYVKLPGQSEGRVVEEAVTLMDVTPTVLDLLGIDVELEFDGRSLAPLLTVEGESSLPPAKPMVYQVVRPGRCRARAIAGERFKLIEIAGNYEGLRDAVRLYDRTTDPGETEDVAAGRPEVVTRLHNNLHGRLTQLARRAVVKEPEIRLDALDQERLRELGYVDEE